MTSVDGARPVRVETRRPGSAILLLQSRPAGAGWTAATSGPPTDLRHLVERAALLAAFPEGTDGTVVKTQCELPAASGSMIRACADVIAEDQDDRVVLIGLSDGQGAVVGWATVRVRTRPTRGLGPA